MVLKKIKTQRYVYHVTFRIFRESISTKGLIGKSSPHHKNLINPVFAHNRSVPNLDWYPFVMDFHDWMFLDKYNLIVESNYDYFKLQCIGKGYDFWEIDTYKLKNSVWYIDYVANNDFLDGSNFPYYVVTEGCIPPRALKLYRFHEEPYVKSMNGVAHVRPEFRAVG